MLSWVEKVVVNDPAIMAEVPPLDEVRRQLEFPEALPKVRANRESTGLWRPRYGVCPDLIAHTR